MSTHLRIDDDPTTFVLSAPMDATTLTEATAALQLGVVGPYPGTLILNPAAAGALALQEVLPDQHGIIPTDDDIAVPYLYVPSSAGLTATSPGSQLPASPGLAALAGSIETAMNDGDPVRVSVSGVTGNGTVVLNGAVLAFAVVYNVITTGSGASA
jgi:hypothetical protein